MNYKMLGSLFALTLTLVACATPEYYWTKTGLRPGEFDRDGDACDRDAMAAVPEIANGTCDAACAVRIGSARGRYANQCLRAKGYYSVPAQQGSR
jgi:hypothetical protein